MRVFFQSATLTLTLLSTTVFAADSLKSLPTMSRQQVDTVTAALASGSIGQAQLSSLPNVRGKDITLLKAFTGFHPISPNSEEDYFAFGAMVGRQFFSFRFTVKPKLDQNAEPPDLSTILGSTTVTQYAVSSVDLNRRQEIHYVACYSRDSFPFCRPRPAP